MNKRCDRDDEESSEKKRQRMTPYGPRSMSVSVFPSTAPSWTNDPILGFPSKQIQKDFYQIPYFLKHNTIVQQLYLSGIDFDTDDILSMACMFESNHTIHKLHLSSIKMSNGGIDVFAQVVLNTEHLTSLTLFSIKDSLGVGPPFISAMGKNTSIRKLSISRCRRAPGQPYGELFTAISSNTTLEKLKLNDLFIEDSDVPCILGITSLRSLDLERNIISNATPFVRSPTVNQLRKLVLSRNEFDTSFDGPSIIRVLDNNTNLVSLRLGETVLSRPSRDLFSEKNLDRLGGFLRQNTTLTELCLRGNSVGGSNGKILVDSLLCNQTLQKLNVETVYLNLDGVRCFYDFLASNPRLRKLRLSSTLLPSSIDYVHTDLLIECLERNTNLISLKLDNQRIGTHSAEDFWNKLSKNTTLQELRIGFRVSDMIKMHHLTNFYEHNNTMRVFINGPSRGSYLADISYKYLEIVNSIRKNNFHQQNITLFSLLYQTMGFFS